MVNLKLNYWNIAIDSFPLKSLDKIVKKCTIIYK